MSPTALQHHPTTIPLQAISSHIYWFYPQFPFLPTIPCIISGQQMTCDGLAVWDSLTTDKSHQNYLWWGLQGLFAWFIASICGHDTSGSGWYDERYSYTRGHYKCTSFLPEISFAQYCKYDDVNTKPAVMLLFFLLHGVLYKWKWQKRANN